MERNGIYVLLADTSLYQVGWQASYLLLTMGRTKKSPERFAASWDGFIAYREATGSPLQPTSQARYRPIVRRLEELRVEMFGNVSWREIAKDDITFGLIEQLVAEIKGRDGKGPAYNTIKARHDACRAYFAFLKERDFVERNPMLELTVKRAEASVKPSLDEIEDTTLFEIEKLGHEVAIYALARGCALREGEICALRDADVDLVRQVVVVRDGKTEEAAREVPITLVHATALAEYRRWRDEWVRTPKAIKSPMFVKTDSGRISGGYVWKLVKAMALRAELRLVVDDDGARKTDKQGNPKTAVTPHSLRRTYGADHVRRGVPTVVISKVLGHKTPRVTEESYCQTSKQTITKQMLLSDGADTQGFRSQVEWLHGQVHRIEDGANVDPQAALAQLAQLEATIDAARERISWIIETDQIAARMLAVAA